MLLTMFKTAPHIQQAKSESDKYRSQKASPIYPSIVMEDMNAKVSKNDENWKGTIECYNLRVSREQNDKNGTLMADFSPWLGGDLGGDFNIGPHPKSHGYLSI